MIFHAKPDAFPGGEVFVKCKALLSLLKLRNSFCFLCIKIVSVIQLSTILLKDKYLSIKRQEALK